jgi:hypothetical protein
MLARFFKEIRLHIAIFSETVQTREFWIYMAVIFILSIVAVGCAYLAFGFDSLTRRQLLMAISCRTGEAQIGTIIIGSFAFGLACLFTLGEVTYWVEQTRQARSSGRRIKLSAWRPILYVLGTVVLGIMGFFLMSAWCF